VLVGITRKLRVQAEQPTGQGGTEAWGLAGQAGCPFLLPDSGPQDCERNHEYRDKYEA
jgi:hypothetical protein